MRERDRRRKNNAARAYIPNGKAEEFIRLVGRNETFISAFIAANAVGKSAAGAAIVSNICYGVQNPYFDLPLFQNFPYLKKGRIISDPTTLKEKIIPELKKWFPKNSYSVLPHATYETKKEGKNFEAKFQTNTGFAIDLMSNEQDVKEFESVDLGFVWIDEPIPKDRFLATVARGRMGMVIFMTLTPLKYSAWIKEEIVDRRDGKYADYVEAEVEDNCRLHGVRGILEHANIERMVAAYPEDEKLARAFGRFGHLIGRVHKAFNRKIHVIRPFRMNDTDFCVYHALDPHPRTPDHALWMAVDRRNQKHVIAELVAKGTTPELAAKIKAIEMQNNMRVVQRIIDPYAFNRDQHNDQPSVASVLAQEGLEYDGGSKDLDYCIRRTDDALSYEMREGQMIVSPEVFFWDTNVTAIKQIEEYVWDDYRGRHADEKQPKARPKDVNDHQVENLHRLLALDPVFVPKPKNVSYDARVPTTKSFDPY